MAMAPVTMGDLVMVMRMRGVMVLLLLLVFLEDMVKGQDDGGMDMDLESMNAPEGDAVEDEGGPKGKLNKLTAIQQTSLALQQLGIVIGVAFMVAFLFMVMIGLEKLWDKMEESYRNFRGKGPAPEVDPAALVGTFSRYKN